jgi:ligand-binding sensor domain-containing protein
MCLGDPYVFFASSGGVLRLNVYSNRYEFPWTVSNGLASDDVYVVAYDFNTGYLWCLTKISVSYLEPAARIWNNLYFDEIGLGRERAASIGFSDRRTVYIVTPGNRWFESENSAVYFRPCQAAAEPVRWFGRNAEPEPAPPYLFMSDNYMYNERDKTITDFQLRKFPVTCWLRDRFQNLYIGTWGLGAGHANLATFRLDMLPYGLWDPVVDAIEPDGDAFWLGGEQDNRDNRSGVTEWSVDVKPPRYYEAYLHTGFGDDRVKAFAITGANVWLGTRNGLIRHDFNKDIWRSYTQAHHLTDNRINDLVADDHFLYVATDAGVSRVQLKSVGTDTMHIQSVKNGSLGTVTVYDLAQQQNLLWMGTEYGIYVYDTEQDSGGFYKGADGPSNRATFAVSVYNDEVWFGTEEGVAAFDVQTREWLTGPGRLYRADAAIYRILATEAAVWVATDKGLLKYDRDGQRWVTFTVEDGLPDMRVYALFADGDYLWLGTPAGLTRFYWNSPHRID